MEMRKDIRRFQFIKMPDNSQYREKSARDGYFSTTKYGQLYREELTVLLISTEDGQHTK
ncbi:Hypothetical predicted protein [Mytilus galloprovincialis]|uniref:Uncharacterized protein n=1 Tax=Mytilus galloprovincialis TaxID=29158 RepID=A0A8B6DS07_MYTGA|nr:Hypothetical predicted protein [Mytilus galloprovincialis]